MEECKIKNLYNLEETIAKELLEKSTYPWEVLPKIEEFIIESNTIQIPEPSNEVKIEAAGFDKVTSFRKPKEEKKRKNVKENKPNNIRKSKRGE